MIKHRWATSEDVPAIVDFWRNAETDPSPTDDPWSVLACLDRDGESILLAEDEGCLVGVVIATWDGWRGNLYRLAVAPSNRRQGIADALVEAAEHHLARKGACRISALVLHDNPASLGLFDKRGWHIHHEMLRLVGPRRRRKRPSEG